MGDGRQGMAVGKGVVVKYKDIYLRKCHNEIHYCVQLKIRK